MPANGKRNGNIIKIKMFLIAGFKNLKVKAGQERFRVVKENAIFEIAALFQITAQASEKARQIQNLHFCS